MNKVRLILDYARCGVKLCIIKIISCFVKPEIYPEWIISERGDDARDNGYVFYEYIRKYHPEIKVAYIIKSDSADFSKVNSIGNTIEYGSFKHYMALVKAKYLVSSHIMGFTPNPGFFVMLDKKINYLKFIVPGKKVFLQHGIIKDYIKGLCYPTTKVDVFICGAKPEFEYILNNYNYPKGVVNYTGLARYDKLLPYTEHKQILVMPTWRKWLNSYSIDEFKKSDYYLKYQSLINNEKLNKVLIEYGYTLVFYPHYEMQKFLPTFSAPESVRLASIKDYDVQKLLKESELLITDYSSVYFDMAYMNKPIVFYQFDQEHFFAEHYQRGYFDESAFGIVTGYEDIVVNTVIKHIKKMLDNTQYKIKEKEFFTYRDDENCKRIFNVIIDNNTTDK